MTKRVVVTGMSGISALGHDWPSIAARLDLYENVVEYIPEWENIKGLRSKLAAPIKDFILPETYSRKKVRGMSL